MIFEADVNLGFPVEIIFQFRRGNFLISFPKKIKTAVSFMIMQLRSCIENSKTK